ncbi:MAG: preprotein translocase subunit SecY [Clostridia bacterium]|nr:preprotein translocase subunit SecY [Clostridia bacterium]
MFKTLRNAWAIPDLRKKMIFTILMLIVYRFGSMIPVPGLDAEMMKAFMAADGGMGLFSLLDTFSGGALSNATIFAMGISPYINSSIIIQLLTVAIPALERLSKQGEEGRKKINSITRYATIILALLQAVGLYFTLKSYQVVSDPGVMSAIVIMLTFTAGTAFVMWIGEEITDKGIGNGISLIIFAGIISRLPSAVVTLYNQFLADISVMNVIMLVLIVAMFIAVLGFVVFMNNAERRIPIQYAKRVVGRKMYGGQSTNIPIKVAMAGVMPIIFASSICMFPATIMQFFGGGQNMTGFWKAVYDQITTTGWVYAIVYFVLIIFFTYFYTAMQYNPIEMANNIKKNGGFIPGIRPGKPTSDFISKTLNRVVLVGALFLGLIAVLPIFLSHINQLSGIAMGGTSLLIVEGVALETVKQIESQMMMRHYKGFLE